MYATHIKTLCKKQGITITDLANMIGTTQPHLSRVLGDNGNPEVRTLERIASALKVPLWRLFVEYGEAVEYIQNNCNQSIDGKPVKLVYVYDR